MKASERARAKRRLSDAEYRRNRILALERDDYRCRRCGTGYSLIVHHLVPRSAGVDHSLNNLCTLCNPCHLWAHSWVAKATAAGYIKRRRAG